MQYKHLFIILSGIFIFCACMKSESELQIEDNKFENRFTFPQGNSSEDQFISSFAQKYDSYIIYKGFTGSDISKSWLAHPNGTNYIAKPIGYNERMRELFNILKSNIFDACSQKLTEKIVPVYIFLCDSIYKTETYNDGLEDKVYKTDINYILTGQDFWAFSLLTSILESDVEFKAYLCKIKYDLFNKMNNRLLFKLPIDEFIKLSDYETATTRFNKTDPNYYLNRGFIDIVKSSFKGKPSPFYLYKARQNNNYADFEIFLKAAIYYTDGDFEKLYPQEKYPLIHEKYNFVKKCVKQAGFDLTVVMD